MKFHLVELSMTLSDLEVERANRGQAYFRGP